MEQINVNNISLATINSYTKEVGNQIAKEFKQPLMELDEYCGMTGKTKEDAQLTDLNDDKKISCFERTTELIAQKLLGLKDPSIISSMILNVIHEESGLKKLEYSFLKKQGNEPNGTPYVDYSQTGCSTYLA